MTPNRFRWLLTTALATLVCACEAQASDPDSPQALKDAFMRAHAGRDADALFALYCTAGSSPRYIEMYKEDVPFLFGLRIEEVLVLMSAEAAHADQAHTIKPLGRIVLRFDRRGQPGPEIHTEQFRYFGVDHGRYCFGIPVEPAATVALAPGSGRGLQTAMASRARDQD